ncbi:MAG TPA: O-antigen ligase family protein [Bryobacteraceae bacterium]
MHVALAAIFFFALITYVVPAMWPASVFQLGTFILSAFALFRGLPRFAWPMVPLTFAIFWGLLQLVTGHTANAYETKTDIVNWTTFLAVFLAGVCLFRDSSVRRWFRHALVWFGFFVSVVAIIQICTSDDVPFWSTPLIGYVIGPLVSRNHFAAFIELVFPIALYESLQGERDSLLYSGVAAVMYASLVASASRAGALLCTSELLLVVLVAWIRGRANSREVGGTLFRILLLFALFTTIMGWNAVWARFWAPDPMAFRREFYIASLHIVDAHPWFGTGLGTWATVYPRWAIVDSGWFANQAHNDWLQWAAEGGIPFCVMLSTLFVWAVPAVFRNLWGLGVIAVFLHALVDYPFSRPTLAAWPFLILAMLAASKNSSDETNAELEPSPES